MSLEKAPYTSFLQNESKCDLGSLDIFDKVINLKLTLGEKDSNGNVIEKEQYVIRSDYEVYFPDLMKAVSEYDYDSVVKQKRCYIRKCTYKPSIKVQYRRVSMDVGIEVDIFLNNFFMLDKNGKYIKNFNNDTFRLVKLELAMGYFGQFQASLGDGKISEITAMDLFDFDKEKLKGNGITLITISDVPYVQTDKLPPDMTVHIHGFVGNFYTEKLQNIMAQNNVPDNYQQIVAQDRLMNYSKMNKKKRSTILEETFYQSITRNWVREGSLPKDTTIQLVNNENFTVKGTLSDTDAEKYGIQVYWSNGALEYAKKYDEDKILIDSNGNKQMPSIKIPIASTAMQKANEIKRVFGLDDLCIAPIATNSDLVIYLSSELEDMEKMIQGTPLENSYKKDTVALYWNNKLPAIYNITVDALCTISSPFFFFVNPFDKFYFSSRYALSGLVSYFANFNATEDEFYALWQTVSFATVEDVNESEIVCVGRKSNKGK